MAAEAAQQDSERLHQYFTKHKVVELFDGLVMHLDADQPADPVLGAIWYLAHRSGLKPPAVCPEPSIRPGQDDDAERLKRDKDRKEKERLEREKKQKEDQAKREEALRKANEQQSLMKKQAVQDEGAAADMASCF
eukprot:TRINITY_DN61942_c0_g1_i1.p3 TRINITY_DN61942_c0_g1~~TRINITY_DN61942_c0_g1_i1.p3  ORF type:complete len:135 (+),score=67.62 TRINITY_DN61942_c0_g1_i1:84-488(+)